MSHKPVVILYHADCPDGFGGAYAAWKKFGDEAEYIPVKHNRPVPTLESARDVYVVDFCYPKDVMDTIAGNAKSLTVLDHHKGIKEVVESFPGHVYDEKRSGAVIAWNYFHPDTPVPLLLQYVQAGDLYTFDMPDARAALSYLYTHHFHFEEWDRLRAAFEDDKTRASMFARGAIYYEYYSLMVAQIAARAELVEFEGYEVYLGSAPSQFLSDVGHELCKKKGPLALVAGIAHDGIKVSLRGDGTVDVSELARRFEGNGHPNSSAFFVPWGQPLPWKPVPKDENPRD